MNKRLKSYKGITLIALVITIIVLLILAGVSIAMLTGENGILNRAVLAREEASHAEVKEQVLLAIAEYELEKKTPEGSKATTIIDYLGQNGYLTEYDSKNPKDSYIIPKAKLGEATLGKGASKETGDVYVIEKANLKAASITKLASTQEVGIKIAEESTDNNWALKYYKISNDENPKVLLNFPISKSSSPSKPEQTVANILKIGDYVKIPITANSITKDYDCLVLYDNQSNEENSNDYGIQVVTLEPVIQSLEISSDLASKLYNEDNNYLDWDNFPSSYIDLVINGLIYPDYCKNNPRCFGSQPQDGYEYRFEDHELDDKIEDIIRLRNCLGTIPNDWSCWIYALTDSNYWSDWEGDYSECGFACLKSGTTDKSKLEYLYYLGSNPPYDWNGSDTYDIRICLKINDETLIQKGTGDKNDPYQLVAMD